MLLDLYISFLKIGASSFGGISMIPLINAEMIDHGWMTAAEVLDIIAIAEMTPGPIGINCATFVGTRVGGVWGSICATLGALTPSLSLCLIAGMFFEKFKHNRYLQSMLGGIRPASFGMIAYTAIFMGQSNYLVGWAPYWPGILIGIMVSIIIWKWKISIPKTIGIAAVLGLLVVR